MPAGYQLKTIDSALYQQILTIDWAQDLCYNYPSYKDYQAQGLGVVALRCDEIVAGASFYISYPQGIEVQVDIRKDQRRQGLALACSAALILACLARGWYPSWDAHNEESLTLAEKLGYHLDKAYPVYVLGEEDGETAPSA